MPGGQRGGHTGGEREGLSFLGHVETETQAEGRAGTRPWCRTQAYFGHNSGPMWQEHRDGGRK